MKYGIYIVESETLRKRLFAVARDEKYVTQLRNLARHSLDEFSSDWVSVYSWNTTDKHWLGSN